MKLGFGASFCLSMAIVGNMIRFSRVLGFGVARRRVTTMGSLYSKSENEIRNYYGTAKQTAAFRSASIMYMSTASTAAPAVAIKSIDFVEEAEPRAIS